MLEEWDSWGGGYTKLTSVWYMVRSLVLCHGVCYAVVGYIQPLFVNKNKYRPVRLHWMRGMCVLHKVKVVLCHLANA